MYLNAGVYTGTPQWDKCSQQCDDIINQATTKGSYLLEPRYRDIFRTNNEGSKELIFTVPYDETFGTEFQIHMKTLDPLMQQVFPMQVQPWGGDCAVPQFIDSYDADDTRMKDTWIQGPQYSATTGALVITYTKSVNSIEKSQSNEGYRIGKYEIKPNAKAGLSNDFPIFRYADILMMKAECLLRTGHADDAAVLVTQVRQRDFTNTPAKATVTGAQLQQGSSYQYGYWDNGAITQLQGEPTSPLAGSSMNWDGSLPRKATVEATSSGLACLRQKCGSSTPAPARTKRCSRYRLPSSTRTPICIRIPVTDHQAGCVTAGDAAALRGPTIHPPYFSILMGARPTFPIPLLPSGYTD
ncbi:RagB/SusD family nutrient uptake outer membrane protein [Puia sp. P3]|uniref:RagB/SusD family nutrient uptake outer membrane protein n=1 Tax=Puia sp. P3 TaxID=3423952 RepID=UPI003D674814